MQAVQRSPDTKWDTPPRVVENDQAKILFDLQSQTDKLTMANQPHIVVENKHKQCVVINVVILRKGTSRTREAREIPRAKREARVDVEDQGTPLVG